MHDKPEILRQLCHPGIVAVIRCNASSQVLPVCRALVSGGVCALEITLTTPNALQAVRDARGELGDRAVVGVGTVLDAVTCRDAIDSGAEFVVTPVLRTELIEITQAEGLPIMLGAYTPTEAQRAYEAGADFIKIFPADTLGPGYVKSLLAPLPHLKIVPTGGVDLQTAKPFLEAGCAALGVGSSLISRSMLARNDWAGLTQLATQFVAIARSVRRF